MRSEPPVPTWLVVCCAALLAFVLFGGPLAATLAQSPTPEPSYEELLAEEFGQPDGYEVDTLDLPGYNVDLVIVRDGRTNVTCYLLGETMTCLNTYGYSK